MNPPGWLSGARGLGERTWLCTLTSCTCCGLQGGDSGCGGRVPPQEGEGVLGKVLLKLTWKRGGADSAYLGGGICLLAVPAHMLWAQGPSLISASPPVKWAA